MESLPLISQKRLREVLVKDMETTIVVKLLGRNIGYGVLHDHISSLWRPSQPFSPDGCREWLLPCPILEQGRL